MPAEPRNDEPKIDRPKKIPADRAKPTKQAREALREQAKTEVEERPYLDTEGGE